MNDPTTTLSLPPRTTFARMLVRAQRRFEQRSGGRPPLPPAAAAGNAGAPQVSLPPWGSGRAQSGRGGAQYPTAWPSRRESLAAT